MENVTVKARAKVNLTLDILRRREDGYHELAMIMQSLSLHDNITLSPRDSGIEVSCNHPEVPAGDDNIAVRAAKAILQVAGCRKGVFIRIEKNIPVAAGLAGGSSNAAAVLKGINELYGLGMDHEELARIGLSIGADVPFCLLGGTALAEGIGDKLTPLKTLPCFAVVLVKPPYPVSTARVYSLFRLDRVSRRPSTTDMIQAIERGEHFRMPGGLVNVLETVTLELHPDLVEIKQYLLEAGALGALMSGSGPTVFGLFDGDEKAGEAAGRLREKLTPDHDVIVTTTWPSERSME